MSWITSRTFWEDTGERTVSSAAQGFIAGASLEAVVFGPELLALNLADMAAAGGIGAGIMAALTLAKCLVTAGARKDNVPAIGTYQPKRAKLD